MTDDGTRPEAGSRGHGLTGRPGQRRAVRVTAVALGLLALALGVRDATTDDETSPREQRQEQQDGGRDGG